MGLDSLEASDSNGGLGGGVYWDEEARVDWPILTGLRIML
jgi:hypothetical protein